MSFQPMGTCLDPAASEYAGRSRDDRLTTAKGVLGLESPPMLCARADKVIE
jgi:hypothetical protein